MRSGWPEGDIKIRRRNPQLGSCGSPDPQRVVLKHMRKYSEGYHFVTIVTNNRFPIFEIEYLAYISINTLNFYHRRKDLDLLGYVIMPDHIHFICSTQKSISNIVRDIKKYIAKEIINYLTHNDLELLT